MTETLTPIDALALDLQRAIARVDAEVTLNDWRQLENFRERRDKALDAQLQAIMDDGLVEMTWHMTPNLWIFNAMGRRAVSTITLHLAIRKWIDMGGTDQRKVA